MELTEAQYDRIAPHLPVQRGNVRVSNLQVLNAILYMAEHGCKWRGLPSRFGNWHTIYMRYKSLVEERRAGPGLRTTATRTNRAGQARGGVDGQPRCQGASGRPGSAKENGPQSIGRSHGGWATKIHMVAADARTAIGFSLSPGHADDRPEGRKVLNRLGKPVNDVSLIVDRAYEGNETRLLILALGSTPLVPTSGTRILPWGVRPRGVEATLRA